MSRYIVIIKIRIMRCLILFRMIHHLKFLQLILYFNSESVDIYAI